MVVGLGGLRRLRRLHTFIPIGRCGLYPGLFVMERLAVVPNLPFDIAGIDDGFRVATVDHPARQRDRSYVEYRMVIPQKFIIAAAEL